MLLTGTERTEVSIITWEQLEYTGGNLGTRMEIPTKGEWSI